MRWQSRKRPLGGTLGEVLHELRLYGAQKDKPGIKVQLRWITESHGVSAAGLLLYNPLNYHVHKTMGCATREPEKTIGGRQNDLTLLYDKLLNRGICVLIQQILSADDIHKTACVLSSRNGLEQ